MKKVITALSTGLLAFGLTAGIGISAATSAGAVTLPTMSVTSANTGQTAVAGCLTPSEAGTPPIAGGIGCGTLGNLSRTVPDSFTVSIANSVSGDTYEAAVCNSDANEPSPLTGVQSGCNEAVGGDTVVGDGGTVQIIVPFAAGDKMNTNSGKKGGVGGVSKCAPGGTQAAFGVACIVAAADLTEAFIDEGGGDVPVWTSDISMAFAAKSTSSTWSDKKGADLKVKGGFATFGLYLNPAWTGPTDTTDPEFIPGCQAFVPGELINGLTPTPASWGTAPLCLSNDGAATGEGVVAAVAAVNGSTTNPAVGTVLGSTTANAGLCPALATTCTPEGPINNAGGAAIDISCPDLLALGAQAGDVWTFAMEGVGFGPTVNYDGASGNAYTFNVTITAGPTGRNICGAKTSGGPSD